MKLRIDKNAIREGKTQRLAPLGHRFTDQVVRFARNQKIAVLMSGRISHGCSLMTWQWALSPSTAFHGQGQEAVEIGENRHTFLHSFTFVVWDGNEVKREIGC